ncbi:hypothetical protein AAG602_02860 [Citromicrobium bathyomarinum]
MGTVKKLVIPVALSLSALATSGCVTMRGAPVYPISLKDSNAVLEEYKIPSVLQRYREMSPAAQREFRDEVMWAYFQAIDRNYYEFRVQLSSEQNQLRLGFDIAQLGLAGLATIAEKSASELAAVSAVYAGTSASVDKNLYFDQSAAALKAAMDAERLKIRTAIVRKQGRPASEYPITAALADLVEYQNAGTLDAAIALITDQAVEERVAERQRYDSLVRFACTTDQQVELDDALERRLGSYNGRVGQAALTEAQANSGSRVYRDAMAASAALYGVALPDGMAQIETEADVVAVQRLIGLNYRGGYCTDEEINGLVNKIEKNETLRAILNKN